QASRIDLSLEQRKQTIVLSIGDDGVGGADAARGSGLVGLADRVEALGGSFRFTSRPGEGSQIAAEVPRAPSTHWERPLPFACDAHHPCFLEREDIGAQDVELVEDHEWRFAAIGAERPEGLFEATENVLVAFARRAAREQRFLERRHPTPSRRVRSGFASGW